MVQDERKGLGDAVLAGEHVLDETFTVVLGDNFFSPKTFLKDLIDFHVREKADSTIGVAEVEDVTRHGIITPSGNRIIDIDRNPTYAAVSEDCGIDKPHGCGGTCGHVHPRFPVGGCNRRNFVDVFGIDGFYDYLHSAVGKSADNGAVSYLCGGSLSAEVKEQGKGAGKILFYDAVCGIFGGSLIFVLLFIIPPFLFVI